MCPIVSTRGKRAIFRGYMENWPYFHETATLSSAACWVWCVVFEGRAARIHLIFQPYPGLQARFTSSQMSSKNNIYLSAKLDYELINRLWNGSFAQVPLRITSNTVKPESCHDALFVVRSLSWPVGMLQVKLASWRLSTACIITNTLHFISESRVLVRKRAFTSSQNHVSWSASVFHFMSSQSHVS